MNHTTTLAPERVSVLAVGLPEQDGRFLKEIAARDDWGLRQVKTMAEALAHMPVQVVVCQSSLPDGDWKALLEQSFHWLNPPRVIVSSFLADDGLWAEVLNLGGYDVLAAPLRGDEVSRVVGLACDNWREATRQDRPKRMAVPAR